MLDKYFRPAIFALLLPFLTCLSPTASAVQDNSLALFHASISPDGTRAVFTWQGDIWLTDIASGECRRLTDNIAYDHHPAWFPDSRSIAFSSGRDGNDDVYTMSIDGGEPVRHTWFGGADIVLDVSPDGSKILFRSSRSMWGVDLYEVDLNGGLEKPVTRDTGMNLEADYSPDGRSIAVCRGVQSWVRRGYHGSANTDIYVMNRDGSDMRWIENGYDGMDYWPRFDPSGQFIYFISDRDLGDENIFRIPATGGPAERITGFANRPVHWLTVAKTERLCFTQGFHLWIKDPDSEPRIVDLKVAADPKHTQTQRFDMSGFITEMELSPDAAHLALIARGDLFVSAYHNPDDTAPLGDTRFWEAVRITDTPSRERYVAWHPDSDRVVLVSDRDGNGEIYEIDLRTTEWTRLTNTCEDEYFPQYSPDGSRLAFFRGKRQLVVMDLESRAETVIVDDLLVDFPGMSNYGWSPDNRWIAYSGNDPVEESDVFIVSVDPAAPPGIPVNITRHQDWDGFQAWAKNGKDLVFLSSRSTAYGLNPYASWQWGAQVYTVPLQHEPFHLSDRLEFPEEEPPASEQPAAEESTGEAAEEPPAEEEKPIEINFDRIWERSRLVSSTRAGGWIAALSPDCKTFVYESSALGYSALWTVPYEGGSADMIAATRSGVDDIEWLPDSSGALYLSGGRVSLWDTHSVMDVAAYGRLTVDLQSERRQMIQEAGRTLKENFYDPDMHDIDWDSIIALYTPLAEQAATHEEFELLLEMMFGELHASHLGAYGGSSFEGTPSNIGMLGLDFDLSTTGPGLRVASVWPRGPADYDETRINPGEWVMEINGTPVSTSMNYYSLLDDTGERTTVLKVADVQNGDNIREVTLSPLPWSGGDPLNENWYNAMYLNWVDSNRKKVDEGSSGRIGYIHIYNMLGGPLEEFARELFNENADKEALIIDVRFNTGGNIHEYLLDILSRERFGYARNRGGELIQQPARRWDRPIVLLINERSFSDAEIFPNAFKELNLGTLMGTTTSGGVIGTVEYQLIDGTTWMRIPRVGWFTNNMTDLENLGITPDLPVEQDINHIRDGIDDQLNAAITYLLDHLTRP
jgi:tricorn protease